jgi:F-type H+-transporting ATPase subunit delta
MTRFARPYARAFLEAAPAGYDVDSFLGAIANVARAIARDRRLRNFFGSPSVPADAKRGALAALAARASVDEFGQRLLRLALENRRILFLDQIVSAIREESDRKLGIVEAMVTVAAPLNDGDGERIEQALARQLGRRVRMRVQVDSKILAGFVARVGSEVFDASAERAIERFQGEAAGTGA